MFTRGVGVVGLGAGSGGGGGEGVRNKRRSVHCDRGSAGEAAAGDAGGGASDAACWPSCCCKARLSAGACVAVCHWGIIVLSWRRRIPFCFSLNGAMRQRKLGSHTPPCHKRMVITTLFSVLLDALQRRPVLYHTRWSERGGGGG